MEHEFFVPVAPARLSHALRTPAVVSASLPGWQPDPDPDAASEGADVGRMRLRVAGSTITYRGSVRVTGESSPFAVEASGTEVRGNGGVKAVLEIGVAEATHPEPGSLLTFRGSAEADGRLTTYEAAVVEAAVRRLLDRFSTELAAHAPEEAPTGEEASAGDGEGEAAASGTEAQDEPEARDAPEDSEAQDEPEAQDRTDEPDEPEARDEPGAQDEPEADVVDDLGEPADPSELDDFELVEVEVEVPESAAALDDLDPPAEAAHARRTMIGRSAEEVDHAPPRGRYAPVPAPDSTSAAATLRWAAPAAAALVASAVVVGRVLRRRR